MYDLLVLAYQSDVTRVFTFMSDRELSQRTYPQIGVSETASHGCRTTATIRRTSPKW
jgi:hypothetical protein